MPLKNALKALCFGENSKNALKILQTPKNPKSLFKALVFAFLAPFVSLTPLKAQSIDISRFYYRDYLDFGQNKGAFNNENSNSTTLTGKDGKALKVPNVPDFSPSSRNGSLTAIGRGYAVTANHVVNFTPDYDSVGTYRKFGLSTYEIADTSGGSGISQPYGRDEKFARFSKYIVEGSVDMLDFANSIDAENAAQESVNLNAFKERLNALKNENGDIYLYQAGSGVITLRDGYSTLAEVDRNQDGETRGGGFGTLVQGSIRYETLVLPSEYCDSQTQNCGVRGIMFSYAPNLDFNNRITSGDSGSGLYAYDSANAKWVLLGVVSQSTTSNVAYISAVSSKDFENYQNKFTQSVNLNGATQTFSNFNGGTLSFEQNKDVVFSGGGEIKVGSGIYRNVSGYAGGFVFEGASTQTTYKFTNYTATTHIFKGSGLDIGENVEVEWALRNASNDSLHKIGLGTLIVKTSYTPNTNENLGYLKVGQGKVIFDTATKAYEGVYITSGRGELELKAGKAEGLGAVKNSTLTNSNTNATNSSANSANLSVNSTNSLNSNANSYTLAQDNANNMGFYFGTGGGKLDLGGNSLTLNTIAANDSKAFITNSSTLATLEIQGFGYENNNKTATKTNTIIHASIANGANFNANSTNSANLNLVYKDSKTHNVSLVFDGHIDIKGALNAENSNIVLQGHPTTHASISDTSIASKVQNAESGTSAAMPSYMDLSRPSTLQQPDWDSRYFGIADGIDLKNSSLNVGKAAIVNANITADSGSKITFGGVHFIDKKDGKNVGGSGFYYNQSVESETLANESYEDSLYVGTITADGAKITSNFANFAPNLELSNSANLTAKNLILNGENSVNLNTNSSASVQNLVFKGLQNNDFLNKFTLENNATFSVKALGFDDSSFDLDILKTALNAKISLDDNFDLSILNGSKITASDFSGAKISIENASFNVKNLSSANFDISLSNAAIMGVESISASVNLSSDSTSLMSVNLINLNDNFTLKSANTNSIFNIKRLEFDAGKVLLAQISNANLLVSESLILQNVGQNLASKSDSNADFAKDFLAFDLGKNLTLKNAKVSVNFVQNLGENKDKISLDNYYTIFAASLENVSFELNSQILDGIFAQGRVENDRFLIKFTNTNPVNFDNLNKHINPTLSPFLEILLAHNKNDTSIQNAINSGDFSTLNSRLARLDESFKRLASTSGDVLQALPLLHRQEINARIRQNRLEKFALDELFGMSFALNDRLSNPTQRSDIAPKLAFWSEKERANRVWSNASAGYFTQDSGKLSLQSLSIGYDKRLLDSKLLLGVLGSLTNASLSDDMLNQSPKIYTLALYSDVLFSNGELQNELSVSFASGEKSFEGESGDYKGFGAFFDSIYKAKIGFLPQSIKPLALVRVSLDSQNAFETRTYKHKAYENISVGLGLGLEWLYERESGFYTASLLVRKDFFQSNDSVEVSLANAQKFITYKLNEPSFIYELHLSGLENFANGLFMRYGVGAYLASNAYKGVKADLQLGYRF